MGEAFTQHRCAGAESIGVAGVAPVEANGEMLAMDEVGRRKRGRPRGIFEGAIYAVVEVLDMGSQCRLAGDEGRPTLVIEDLLPGLAVSALIGVSLPSPQ